MQAQIHTELARSHRVRQQSLRTARRIKKAAAAMVDKQNTLLPQLAAAVHRAEGEENRYQAEARYAASLRSRARAQQVYELASRDLEG